MSCIHYKFRSALEYDTITFDGLSISLADLKHSIITQKKFGKNTDFDLEVTNAQTKEEYKDEMTMIPKNSSVVVRRIPIGTKSKAQLAAERASPFSSGEQKTSAFQDYQVAKSQKLSKVADLANADASEEDKLKAMMKQSGEDWDPSQYVRGRRPYAPGVPVPQSYVCYRCGKPGHFIRNCPTNGDNRFDVPKAKRTTGIPRTFLGTVEGTASPPSRLSPSLPEADSKIKGKEKESANKKVPSELRCPKCSNLLTDAVLIPCCGTSYCDDCIRNYLLENEQECPSCGTDNVSPDSLVINKQLRQAVNSFKNARPASPYIPPPVPKSTSAETNSTEAKPQPQPATKVAADSASDKAVSESKPVENKAVKEINETDNKTKESSPKPAQPVTVKPVPSQPQAIRVHHRDALAQQGVGLKQGGVPFDHRRRQGEFLPRGPPRGPDVRHRLPEPIIPHGLPPEHVPRVPAVRPGMTGPSLPGPRMAVPGFVPGMHAAVPAIPHIPPVPTLVSAPLPHHPAFGAPMFDPLHPADVPRSLTPPMSEREFYKMQQKLKSRGKKKREHEHSSSTFASRESRPRKEPRKEARKEVRKEPKKDSDTFDFDDELSEYRKLQKSRQRLHSRSLTPSRSWSRSPIRSRSRSFSLSRSRSRSRSSPSPARSPTPEGWDESRSPSPAPSRDQGTPASAEEKKKKRKKRKKEPKNKEHKKQKTSHSKEVEPSAEKKEDAVAVKGEAKTSEKKKHKRREKEKANGKEIEEDKDKGKVVVKEKDKKEIKEKGKKKEKDKKKGSDKEKGKEKEEKKSKEKKKKKDKGKKGDSSSGKKRKSKKKHKKHKRHKKEKKDGTEEASKVKDSENQGVTSSEAGGNPEAAEKTSTEDEKEEQDTQDSDEDEQQKEESDEEEDESDSEEREEEKEEEEMDEREQEEADEKMDVKQTEEEGGTGKGTKDKNDSEDEKLQGSGSDEEDERSENDIDEDKLLGNGSDEEKEPKVDMDGRKLEGNGSVVDIGNGRDVKGDQKKRLENKGIEVEWQGKEEKGIDNLSGQAEDVRNRNEQEKNNGNVIIKTTEGGNNKDEKHENGSNDVKQ